MCYKSTHPVRSRGLSDGGIIELRTSPDNGFHWRMPEIQVFSPVEDQDSRRFHSLLAGASSRPRLGCAPFGTCVHRGRCTCVGEGPRSPLLPTLFRDLRICAAHRPRSRWSRNPSHGGWGFGIERPQRAFRRPKSGSSAYVSQRAVQVDA